MPPTTLSRHAIFRRRALAAFSGVLFLTLATPALAPADAVPTTASSSYGVGTAKLDPALPRSGATPVDVLVSGRPGQSSTVVRAVRDHGGTVTATLPMIEGVRASVPAGRLAEIASSTAVTAVTKNREMQFQADIYDPAKAPAAITGSNFANSTGASSLWTSSGQGQGVGVAVLDTGVSPMNDLTGRIVHGPDLSGEGTIIDSYGHGTVMAGIIAGNGTDSADRKGGAYTGMAPKATVVAVKVAGRNGVTDVSTVLQGMHWVAAYQKQFNIRVLNLAWGTPSTQSPELDPLNYAVERLWQLGITVVVAAGNDGPSQASILKPGDDPLVITAGAYDDKLNLDPKDDYVAAWSSRGPTVQGLAKPDLVAPGRTLIATRSYGSAVENDNPKALVSPSYIKGSGTSQATAVTAGAAALLLEARPGLTPDQVKQALTSGASPISGETAYDQGAGRLNVPAAVAADAGAQVRQQPVATGLGSIEASRAGHDVTTDCGQDGTVDLIHGEIDVRCEAWDGAAWTGGAWTGAAWTGAAWTGAAWTGGAWTGGAWTGAAWTGAAWTGGAWTGGAWTGAAWTGGAWTGGAWTSANSDPDDTAFLTAWWGNHPSYRQHIPGEKSDPRPR